MRKSIALTALSLAAVPATAQDFERAYSLENQPISIHHACLLADGGYALAAADYAMSQFIVSRTNSVGEPLWSRSFVPQPNLNIQSVSAIGQFANGDIYLLANGYINMLDFRALLRFDLNGALVWAKQLQFNNTFDADYSLRAAKVIEHPNGDILVSIPATMDPVLAKLSSSGAPLWAKSVTSTEDTLYDKHPTFDCEPADDGGCIVCGKDRDWPYVMKVDANGNVVWNQTYYQVYTYSHLRNMEILPNGDLLFAGMHDVHAMMMRMSPTGTILWMKHYPSEFYFESMQALDDGTFLIMNLGYGSMVHVNSDGDVLSYFTPSSTAMSAGLFAIAGSNGKAHVAGAAYDMNTWEGASYMARFDPDSPPGCMFSEGSMVVVDVPSVANTSGTTTMVQQTEPMVVTDLALAFTSVGLADGLLCGIATSVPETQANVVTVLPTAVASGQPLNVNLGALNTAGFQWVAANGAVVRQQNMNASKGNLSTAGLAPGLYTLLATDQGEVVHTTRIVVE